MPFEIVMPSLGQTTNEVEIIKWLKKEGGPVQQGEPLLEVMTDKANVEVESWASGVLRRILFGEGQKVPSGEVIAIVTAAGEEWSEAVEVAAPRAKAPAPLVERPQAVVKGRPGRVRASPLARKMAAEKGIDLATVTGTGPGGAVTKEDVLRIAAPTAPVAAVRPEEAPLGRLVPLTSMRRAIGRRMVESKTTIPHFYVGLEVDMSEAVKLRQTLNPQLERRGQAAISPTDILIAAAATTLIEFPQVNVRLEEEGIRWIDDVNIGLAVALEEGLIVPVIKRAHTKSLIQIAQERKDLVERARDNRLRADELMGGTFTISNMGVYGVDSFAAIINPPESAILALGRIADRAVAVEGQVVVRPMMTMVLSVDHRLLDGATAAAFLCRLKEIIEGPQALLITPPLGGGCVS